MGCHSNQADGSSTPLPFLMSCEQPPFPDKHNKACQSPCALEKGWLTKDPWFCSVTSLLGSLLSWRHHELRIKKKGNKEVGTQDAADQAD